MAKQWKRPSTLSNSQASGDKAQSLIPLKLYWSRKREDNFITATKAGSQAALNAGYRYARIEACITAADTAISERPLKTRPLKLFGSSARGDNFTTATVRGEHDAIATGYKFVRIEGFVSPTEKPGTIPLKLYWSPGRHDNFTTASRQGAHDAEAAGYRFSRIEGYVYPASKCQSKTSGRR